MHVPSRDLLIVAAAKQLVSRVPPDRGDQVGVDVVATNAFHVESHESLGLSYSERSRTCTSLARLSSPLRLRRNQRRAQSHTDGRGATPRNTRACSCVLERDFKCNVDFLVGTFQEQKRANFVTKVKNKIKSMLRDYVHFVPLGKNLLMNTSLARTATLVAIKMKMLQNTSVLISVAENAMLRLNARIA